MTVTCRFGLSASYGVFVELTAELVCLLISSLLLDPTLWETKDKDMKTVYALTARE